MRNPWDSSLLSLSSATFGDPVLGDQLDLSGFGSFTGVTPSAGSVNLFALSLDPAATLDALQAGSFVLATLQFDALATGTSALSLGLNALGDSLGNPLAATLVDASVDVIPEPGSWALFCVGALIVGTQIYRRQRSPAL